MNSGNRSSEIKSNMEQAETADEKTDPESSSSEIWPNMEQAETADERTDPESSSSEIKPNIKQAETANERAVPESSSSESLADVMSEKSRQGSTLSRRPSLSQALDSVALVKRGRHYTLQKQTTLKNSLLASVGFLELANGCDFAANVFNKVPVPIYAVVLMALGGTVALSIIYFAVKDALLSWRNLSLLREERRYLREQKIRRKKDGQAVLSLDARLNVNFRETGTEAIDRVGMEIFLGFGALCVGIGSFLAIGGANHKMYLASNLLSGYIGNTPSAIYGVANTAWSIYVWKRASRHSRTGTKELKPDLMKRLLKPRLRSVQVHSTINGLTGLVAGVAALITATRWWGYIILLPCIISAVYCNFYWRNRLGYERPFIRHPPPMDVVSLLEELETVASARQILDRNPVKPLNKLTSNSESITTVIEFLVANDLFEEFCVRLLADKDLSTAILGDVGDEVTITARGLLTLDETCTSRILDVAQACVSDVGPAHFKYRQQYMMETLGSYLCAAQVALP